MTPRLRRLVLAVVLAAAAALAVRAWSGGGTRVAPDAFAQRPPDALVVDVRTDAEWAAGHLDGAVHAELGDDLRAALADEDRDRPVYLYCGSGVRSGRAAAVLESMGFTTVVNAGGYQALAGAGAPTATGP